MPTVLTHAAVPLAIGLAAGRERVPWRLVVAGAALAMLPDLDVIAFRFGIPYAAGFGHRGASHSLVMAVALAAVLAAVVPWGVKRSWVFLVLAISMASHGVLDMLTNGGLGIALAWPFSDVRYFFPYRPIAVSPIGAAFFSERGVRVLVSEATWVWLPLMTTVAAVALARRRWTAQLVEGDGGRDRD